MIHSLYNFIMNLKFEYIRKSGSIFLLMLVFLSSCKKDDKVVPLEEQNIVIPNYLVSFDEAGGIILPSFETIAGADEKLDRPNDLAFGTARANELWILNERTSNIGGSTVMIQRPGATDQYVEQRVDGNAWHFMSLPTALAWSNNTNWFTSPGILDANHAGGTFTGPTLWSGDLDIYAKPSGGNGSHLDMLHGSPFSMGIEADVDNACYVFDGWNEELVHYDFHADHGPGNSYHGDGEVLRFTDIFLTRKPGVPSHMRFDKNKEWLYIVDGGKSRIIRVKPSTAIFNKSLPLINEELAKHHEMLGAKMEVFVDNGLTTPCGIEIVGDLVYVTDFETGEIIAYDIESQKEVARVETSSPGVTGICFGNDHLWYVNRNENKLYRIDLN